MQPGRIAFLVLLQAGDVLIGGVDDLSASAIAAGRSNDLPYLSEVQPDEVAGRAVVDDDVAGAVVRVGVEPALAARARETPLECLAVERERIDRLIGSPCPAFLNHGGKGPAREERSPAGRAEVDRMDVVDQRLREWHLADRTRWFVVGLSEDADPVRSFDFCFGKGEGAAVGASEVAPGFDELENGAAVRAVHRSFSIARGGISERVGRLAARRELRDDMVGLELLPQQNGRGGPMERGTSQKAHAAPQKEARIVVGHTSGSANYRPLETPQFRAARPMAFIDFVSLMSKLTTRHVWMTMHCGRAQS